MYPSAALFPCRVAGSGGGAGPAEELEGEAQVAVELTEKVGAAGGWDGAAAAAVKWTLLFLDFVPPRSPTNSGLGGGFHVCMQLVRNGKVDGFDEWSRRLPLGKRLVEGMNKISGDQIDGDTVGTWRVEWRQNLLTRRPRQIYCTPTRPARNRQFFCIQRRPRNFHVKINNITSSINVIYLPCQKFTASSSRPGQNQLVRICFCWFVVRGFARQVPHLLRCMRPRYPEANPWQAEWQDTFASFLDLTRWRGFGSCGPP